MKKLVDYLENFKILKNEIENKIHIYGEEMEEYDDFGLEKNKEKFIIDNSRNNLNKYNQYKSLYFISNKDDININKNLFNKNEILNREMKNKEDKIKNFFLEKYNFKILSKEKENIVQIDIDQITKSDIMKLCPGEYLNDNCINFYIKLLKDNRIINIFEEIVKEQPNKINFQNIILYNTYFYSFDQLEKIIKSNHIDFKNIDDIIIQSLVEDYLNKNKKIFKIFKKYNPFESNDFFIPINKNFHWTLWYVENFKNFVNNFKKDPNNIPNNCKVYIYYCDSLYFKNENSKIFKYILSYFILEYFDYKPKENYYDKLLKYFEFNNALVPFQNNGSDCGICILDFIENIFLNKESFINLNSIQNSENINWFPHSFYSEKRDFMIKIIVKLSETNNIETIKEDFKEMLENKIDKIIN